jgi:alpha-methylacyl-CoA racemase
VATLAGVDTCVAPVLEVAEVATDPHFVARGVVVQATHPTQGSFLQLAPLLAGMERGGRPSLPDMTRTDTEHLLKEAGVDGETVARWVGRKVVA